MKVLRPRAMASIASAGRAPWIQCRKEKDEDHPPRRTRSNAWSSSRYGMRCRHRRRPDIMYEVGLSGWRASEHVGPCTPHRAARRLPMRDDAASLTSDGTPWAMRTSPLELLSAPDPGDHTTCATPHPPNTPHPNDSPRARPAAFRNHPNRPPRKGPGEPSTNT